MANCLYLHDSYITNLDFVNYAFAKFVVAWLYYAETHITLLVLLHHFKFDFIHTNATMRANTVPKAGSTTVYKEFLASANSFFLSFFSFADSFLVFPFNCLIVDSLRL